MDKQAVEDKLADLVKRYGHGSTKKENDDMEELQASFHRIQDNIKIEGRYDIVITEMEEFIDEVGSTPGRSEYGLSLEEGRPLGKKL